MLEQVKIGCLDRAYSFSSAEGSQLENKVPWNKEIVIVSRDFGLDYGTYHGPFTPDPEGPETIVEGAIVRVATQEDLNTIRVNETQNLSSRAVFDAIVLELGLPMKLAAIDNSFDRKKVTFYYRSEERVDFRELLKRLATHFKRRIELYQLNIWDQVLLTPTVGMCGLICCCKLGIKREEPITVACYKTQKSSFHPFKGCGHCGKPLCCMKYEYEDYKGFEEKLPSRDTLYRIDGEYANLVDYDAVKETVTLAAEDSGEQIVLPINELTKYIVARG